MSQYDDYPRLLSASGNAQETGAIEPDVNIVEEQIAGQQLMAAAALGEVIGSAEVELQQQPHESCEISTDESQFSVRETVMLAYMEQNAGVSIRRADLLKLFPDASPTAVTQAFYKLSSKLRDHPHYSGRFRKEGTTSTARYWMDPPQPGDVSNFTMPLADMTELAATAFERPKPKPKLERPYLIELSGLLRSLTDEQDVKPTEGDWQERALCAETDPEAFFPEQGGTTREAKKICTACEVRAQCLEHALVNDEKGGIWGGLSERERRRLRRRSV